MKKWFLILVGVVVGVCWSVNGFGQNTYTLCTSTSDLVAGAKYLVVSAQSGTGYAMGYQNTNNRPQSTVQVTISSNTITTSIASTTGVTNLPYEVTLGGSTGAWTLYEPVYAGYLYAASNSDNYLRTGASVANWTITFSSNAAVMTCTTGGYSRNILRYNSSSSLFSCYSSGQNAVYLYKLNSSTPTITLSESSLTGFSYLVGSGPSAEQSFTVSGTNLTSDISIAAPTNYEISKTSGSGYASPLTFTQTGGTVSSTTVYVRLKSGLSAGNYNSETITASSTGATNKTVTCSGSVSAADVTPPTVTTYSPTDGNTAVTINQNLILTFSENIQAAASGNIVIYKSDATVFETIPYNDTRITYSTNTVTINPTGTFANNTGYYVQISSTAIEDIAGNDYAGINDATTWNFTTVAATSACFTENFSSCSNGNNTTTDGSSTAWAGNTNFPTVVNAYQAGGAVKIGKSDGTGSITSMSLSGISGDITVNFDVKGWTTVEGDIKVTVNGSSQTVSYTAVMSGSFENKSLNFTSVPDGSTLKIETTAKRAFIDNVEILCGPACTAPTTQATSFTSGSITATTMTVGWTRGNGTAGVIVVARSGSAVNADPVSGTDYTANAAYGSGTQIGTGNYVVYKGTGTSVPVTALTSNTTYHYAIYEYNTTDLCYTLNPQITKNVKTGNFFYGISS